jgi:signal transduction histidine kinase
MEEEDRTKQQLICKLAKLHRQVKELKASEDKHRRAEEKLLEYQKQLNSMASQLTLVEEQERRRFATYLHDQIGQALFISKIKLEMLQKSLSSTENVQTLGEILKIIEQMIKDARSLTFELSSPILYQLGLEAALEWLAEQMKEQNGIMVRFEDDKQVKPLNDDMLILLFHAVRELLINVTKHSRARKVKVSTCRYNNHIRVSVEDDGVGFSTSKIYSRVYNNNCFGLFSIGERLNHLGGHLEIESDPGHGTKITLMAPINSKRKTAEVM